MKEILSLRLQLSREFYESIFLFFLQQRMTLPYVSNTLLHAVPTYYYTNHAHCIEQPAAGLDYEVTNLSLLFTDQSRLSVSVPILNDDLFEDCERFFGLLNAVGTVSPMVHLGPILATANIEDDESTPHQIS